MPIRRAPVVHTLSNDDCQRGSTQPVGDAVGRTAMLRFGTSDTNHRTLFAIRSIFLVKGELCQTIKHKFVVMSIRSGSFSQVLFRRLSQTLSDLKSKF